MTEITREMFRSYLCVCYATSLRHYDRYLKKAKKSKTELLTISDISKIDGISEAAVNEAMGSGKDIWVSCKQLEHILHCTHVTAFRKYKDYQKMVSKTKNQKLTIYDMEKLKEYWQEAACNFKYRKPYTFKKNEVA